jgi:hypothetical protein
MASKIANTQKKPEQTFFHARVGIQSFFILMAIAFQTTERPSWHKLKLNNPPQAKTE